MVEGLARAPWRSPDSLSGPGTSLATASISRGQARACPAGGWPRQAHWLSVHSWRDSCSTRLAPLRTIKSESVARLSQGGLQCVTPAPPSPRQQQQVLEPAEWG